MISCCCLHKLLQRLVKMYASYCGVYLGEQQQSLVYLHRASPLNKPYGNLKTDNSCDNVFNLPVVVDWAEAIYTKMKHTTCVRRKDKARKIISHFLTKLGKRMIAKELTWMWILLSIASEFANDPCKVKNHTCAAFSMTLAMSYLERKGRVRSFSGHTCVNHTQILCFATRVKEPKQVELTCLSQRKWTRVVWAQNMSKTLRKVIH